jgi:hypothetical protein
MSGWISEDVVEDSEGVMYSDEAARRNVSRLLQEQVTLFMPEFGRVRFSFEVVVFGFAAVRSQCRFMKIGISEKARKRCVLIWALGVFVS